MLIMKIIVSACLLGENCKYNGGNNENARVKAFLEGHEVFKVCPELAAGLGVPRTPIEIVSGVVTDKNGNCVDAQIRSAVEKCVHKAQQEGVELAILKSRSPTCGVKAVYDGTFSGKLIAGQGVLATALQQVGIQVVDSEDI